MVLWEITLVTAYWLGIPRTYRLALKLQRRLIGPRHPRISDFVQRRLRNVFDVALSVHKGVQSRDLSAGRSVGNFILRFLDRARPSAKIRGPPEEGQKRLAAGIIRSVDNGTPTGSLLSKAGSRNRLFLSQFVQRTPFSKAISSRMSMGIGRMCPGMQNARSNPGIGSYSTTRLAREMSGSAFPSLRLGSDFKRGVFRDDISLWMGRKQV